MHVCLEGIQRKLFFICSFAKSDDIKVHNEHMICGNVSLKYAQWLLEQMSWANVIDLADSENLAKQF